MPQYPSSKGQERTLALFGLECDGTFVHALSVLKAAGLPGDGRPEGMTPHAAKKLSDDELRAALPTPTGLASAVAAGTAAIAAKRGQLAARSAERRAHTQRIVERYTRTTDEEVRDDFAAIARQ